MKLSTFITLPTTSQEQKNILRIIIFVKKYNSKSKQLPLYSCQEYSKLFGAIFTEVVPSWIMKRKGSHMFVLLLLSIDFWGAYKTQKPSN